MKGLAGPGKGFPERQTARKKDRKHGPPAAAPRLRQAALIRRGGDEGIGREKC